MLSPFFQLTLREESQLSTSKVRILRHLYSHEFFTRPAHTLSVTLLLSTLPVFPHPSLLVSRQ